MAQDEVGSNNAQCFQNSGHPKTIGNLPMDVQEPAQHSPCLTITYSPEGFLPGAVYMQRMLRDYPTQEFPSKTRA